jgi:hypothetical protein
VSPSARTNTVHRAVDLIGIGPNDPRRADCVNAVHLALSGVSGYAKDMRKHSRRRGKPGKRADARLHKVLQDLQKAIQDPDVNRDLSEYLRGMFPPVDLAHVIALVEEERRKPAGKRYPYKAQKKLMAAGEAYNLLQQFNKDISAEKGSAFCRLAALLYGEPRTSLQWTCRGVLERGGRL